eukprot:scaffold29610_cov170-Skeletonema_dohrnii-CCMP3373.AAC.1
MAFGGLMICYVFAVGLTKVLVKPKAASDAGQSDESARRSQRKASFILKCPWGEYLMICAQ